jgi:hypothetical protein
MMMTIMPFPMAVSALRLPEVEDGVAVVLAIGHGLALALPPGDVAIHVIVVPDVTIDVIDIVTMAVDE